MAKKNTVQIDVKIDDKGGTKKVGVAAKKTAKDVDTLGKSARNTQKGVKGVAQTASAGAKNFSGMARGMGGVVGAYAALAAQMFALTAAFGFFKRAGDLAVLQAGQKAYASATGIAMKTLAGDIIAATNAQITFKEASQAAAIGTAAGLSADQLTRLGTAAKDAAAILGRDVTDAFNRLVKGVTKAEPELLDELGIILRLDTANRNYADSLGIAVKDLTQFQKSQAVANEVLGQSEAKYSAVLAVTGGSAVNQFNKLGKSMDDLVMRFQSFLLPAANGFAKALGDIPLIAGMGFALLLTGPLKAMGISMEGLGTNAVLAKEKQQLLYDTITNGAVKAEKAVAKLKAQQDKRMMKAAGKSTSGSVTMERMQKVGYHKLSKKDQNQIKKSIDKVQGLYKRHEIISKGIFKGLKASIVMDMVTGFEQIKAAEGALDAADTVFVSKWKLRWASLKVSVTSGAAAVGAFASKALAWAGWVGIAITVFATLWNMFKKDIPKTAAEIVLERQQERIASLVDEYSELTIVQKALFDYEAKKGNANPSKWVASLGNVLGSTDIAATKNVFEDALAFTRKSAGEELREIKVRQSNRNNANSDFGGGSALSMNQDIEDDARERAIRKKALADGTTEDLLTPITKAERDAGAFIQGHIDKIKALNDAVGGADGASIAVTKFGEEMERAFKAGVPLKKEELENLQKLKEGAEEAARAHGALAKLQKESNDNIKTYFKSFAPLSAAESSMIKITTEMKNLDTIIKDSGESEDKGANALARARHKILETELSLINKINEAEHDRKLAQMDVAEIQAEAGRILHKVYKVNATQISKVASAQMKHNNAVSEQSTLNKIIAHQTAAQNAGMKEYTDAQGVVRQYADINTVAQQHQLDVIKKKITSAESLLDWEKELLRNNEAMLSTDIEIGKLKREQMMLGFEKSLMENETRRLQIQKDRIKLLKEERAQQSEKVLRTERTNNPFAYLDEEKRSAELKYKDAVADRVEQVKFLEDEKAIKLTQNDMEYKLLEVKYRLLDMEMLKIAEEFRLVAAQTTEAANKKSLKVGYTAPTYDLSKAARDKLNEEAASLTASSNALTKHRDTVTGLIAEIDGVDGVGGLRQAGAEAIDRATAGKLNKIDSIIAKLGEGKDNLQEMKVLTDGMAHSLEENMTSAFTALVQGTVSAKQAFANMAMSILKDISAMIVKMMVFRMLSSMFGTTPVPTAGVSSIASQNASLPDARNLFDYRNGGVSSNGKKLQGYATGGVARGSTSGYPAMLHGTEAVVPLGNGRSIPVQMSGNGGSTNNIVVNISTDGQSSKEGSSGPDMGKLGGAIATAVQVELQNQKRSGGILNPYGVA